MATVGYEISHFTKSNGTKSIRLRLSHDGKSKYFNSGIFVPCAAISRNGNIKDKAILSQICDMVATFTNRITAHSDEISTCASVNEVYRIITESDQPQNTDIDFFEYAELFISKKQSKKTITGYHTMLTSFRSFIRRKTINFNDITPTLLRSYIQHLNPTRRRASLYLTLMKSVFNAAIKEFNDETIVIKNPFAKIDMPKESVPEKRGLTAEQVRSIANHKCTGKREQFAKDMFLLSFCLVGMNAIDLYDCDTIDGDTITYYRSKTRGRRDDNAKMVVTIPPVAKDVADKYRDLTNKKVFNLHIRYAESGNLNANINKGLKVIGKKVGIDNLQMYCARHSWATIAANDCRMDIYTIHKALNHATSKLKITETYIRQNWKWLEDANSQVMDYVFGGGDICDFLHKTR